MRLLTTPAVPGVECIRMRALTALLDAMVDLVERALPGRVGKVIALIALAAVLAWIIYAASSVRLARWN